MNATEWKKPRHRRLARHELELWARVVQHVTPMPGKEAPTVTHVSAPTAPKISPPGQSHSSVPKESAVTLKPFARLEETTLRELARGRRNPEAKIDLHGMRQAEAHHCLRSFLRASHAGGLRLTLVVTGKGGEARPAGHLHEERGVLRRMLPHWLAAPDLRHIVLGFTEASRRHGGEGAFYVRLRASNSNRIRHTR